MTNLNIDCLTLNLPALSQSDGQRLARQIAEGLTSRVITSEATRDAPNIHVTIPADANADVDGLANQIVTEVLRQLNQTLG